MAANDDLCTSQEEVKHSLSPENIEEAANHIFDELLEKIVLGIVFEVHREAKLGGIPQMSEEDTNTFKIIENLETDIFGHGKDYVKNVKECCPYCNRSLAASRFAPHLEKCMGIGRNSSHNTSKNVKECCPYCNRSLAASRFAPHLEKCMGIGRNSSHNTSRRIANYCEENACGGMGNDNCAVGQEQSKLTKKVNGKKKKDENGMGKNKTQKVTNVNNPTGNY